MGQSLQELKRVKSTSAKDKNVITDGDYRMRDKKNPADNQNTIIINRDVINIKPEVGVKAKGDK